MTVREAFLQVLRIIAAMAIITFVVMHPPGSGSGCYQNARGEEYCPVPDDDPVIANQGE